MRIRAQRAILWVCFVLLALGHLDFWRPQRVVLYFGWVPEELLYRLVWMFLAWLYLLYVCRYHWRGEA